MRALITGICGFAGSHLAEHLLGEGDEVSGIDCLGGSTANISHIIGRVQLAEADVTDREALEKSVRDMAPDVIYHLAGFASVGQAWKMVEDTLRVNAIGLVNLVLAGKNNGKPSILVIGSGEMYGQVDEKDQPITEDTPLLPMSPYALSKVWQEQAADYFASVEDYPLVIARPFNHTGPRQSPRFVCSDFASQLAGIEAGLTEPVIRVGNLESRRDFLDVRDVAAAYRACLLKGKRGVHYNIASGIPYSIKEILNMLVGMCRVKVEIKEEKERFRPVDIALLTGDGDRLREDTGWAPVHSIEEALEGLFDYWREDVRRRGGDR